MADPEDAVVDYTGALRASTASAESDTATVMLSATLRDITAADPASDPDAGDILNATVRFFIYDAVTGAPVAEIPDVPIGLVDPEDGKTAVATVNWTADIGTEETRSYRVVVAAGGYYTGDSAPALVTVTRSRDAAVTGGGFLINEGGAGLLAGDPGRKTHFTLSVQAKQNGPALGSVVIRVRHTETGGILHTYEMRSVAVLSLAVDEDTGTAVINADK